MTDQQAAVDVGLDVVVEGVIQRDVGGPFGQQRGVEDSGIRECA
jgi:hypothetical protein